MPAHDRGEFGVPHIIIKLVSGRSDQVKRQIAEAVTQAIITSANTKETSVSVSIEDIEPDDWTEKVYKPDIIGKPETLVKKPGYNPL
jgi:4-oxalocrotonate tautomerase